MTKKTNNWLFWTGIGLLLIPGLGYAYLLMPFPGSQNLNAISVCFYLQKVLLPLRIAGAIMVLIHLIKYFAVNALKGRVVKIAMLLLCIGCYYVTDVQYKAEAMFEEPKDVKFAGFADNKVPQNYIILGVVHNSVAKAFPVVYLGYHHKIQDNVGDLPVLVTYCTMCRTGRVYSPVVNGKRQAFRLVGARHYNAIIEDAATGSWWYQATGIAAAGPLKGTNLKELPYEQSTLTAWLQRYPASLILQPDKHYLPEYIDLKNYDRIQAIDKDSTLKNKDSLIRKSWVVGVIVNKQAKAYNWRKLVKDRLYNDRLANTPLLVGMEKDSATFHVWDRIVQGKELHFELNSSGQLTDKETASLWDWNGSCRSGTEKGEQLKLVQAYQEYWHSWQHFHPGTLFL